MERLSGPIRNVTVPAVAPSQFEYDTPALQCVYFLLYCVLFILYFSSDIEKDKIIASFKHF